MVLRIRLGKVANRVNTKLCLDLKFDLYGILHDCDIDWTRVFDLLYSHSILRSANRTYNDLNFTHR
jgi:hypothetical protein